jgi:WhiB family redox-sensing transcriptional regulator
MLISCPPDVAVDGVNVAGAQFGIGYEMDPISRNCPDGLPCQVQDAELWFAETPGELERAKTFCGNCPARSACLSGAIDRREPWGVWGGEIFDRGAIVARKRPRGRPRKDVREVAA